MTSSPEQMPIQKKNVAGVLVDTATYASAMQAIFAASRERRSFLVSALAVHGVMTGVLDREHRYRLNKFDLILPDGQPVRWALNRLHHANLSDRVYGPELTRKLCAESARNGTAIYLYGSTQSILEDFIRTMQEHHPGLKIAGAAPSLFRRMKPQEKENLVKRINDSGAGLLFVGLGCPRQEVFAYEVGRELHMPSIAVGAAFPFLAGQIPQAPSWMQKRGLEWLYRLGTEPRRLWRRYLYLNPAYLSLVALQFVGLGPSAKDALKPTVEQLYG